MRKFIAVCLASLPLFAAEPFKVKLHLKNSHLGELYFGTAEGASDKYNPEYDLPAPPPGIQVGYTAFISRPVFLYTDLKEPAEKVSWAYSVKLFPGKPVTVSWSQSDFPDHYKFTMIVGDRKIDMNTVSSFVFEKDGSAAIKAEYIDPEAQAVPVENE